MTCPFLRTSLTALLCLLAGWMLGSDPDAITQLEDWKVYTDSTSALSVHDLDEMEFSPAEQDIPNLGIGNYSSWLKIILPPLGEKAHVEVLSPLIDTLLMYQFVNGELVASDTSGVAFPFSTREIESPNFVFPLARTEYPSELYFKVRSGKQVMFPVRLGTKYNLLQSRNKMDIFFGVYAGLILVMFLYNLFVWFSVRDRNYLLYVIYILAVGLTQLVLNGYGNQYFWPENTWFTLRSVHYFGVISGVATLFFARGYLQIPKYAKWLDRLLIFYLAVYIVAFVLTSLGFCVLAFNLINFCALFSFILIIGAAQILRKGYRPAGYFLIAWSIFLVGVTVFVLKDYGILPYNTITRFALPVGSAIEVVLLSFALADRINQLKREKEKEQEEKLDVLRENERIIVEQNALLESKVEERTRELETSNVELNSTLKDLRDAQSKLVDAEKMASLGLMTAGIAHELNNPINFVSSNVHPLRRDLDDIFEILGAYEAGDPTDPEVKSQLLKARELSKELELDFLKEEISSLITGIADGANRTAEIVKGLRVFSRLDEDVLKKADVNECLESTLVILKSNIKSDAPVERDLSENLPKINCYPGKLNQVFMNIIANSLQAAAATNKPYAERRVSVTSEETAEHIVVRIKDNGIGMSPEVKAKIFDPFYTTKEVGQGTGLGLSIVLGIVNDHQGTIAVETEEGKGTEFILHLSKHL